jgi:hypothetical protein
MALTRPNISQITTGKQTLDARLSQLAAPTPLSGFHRSVLCELAMADALTTAACTTYTYTTLYPQAIAFDQDTGDIFILRSPVGSMIANTWSWVSVYDGTTFAHKTLFAITNVEARETIVVKNVGGVRTLFTSDVSTNRLWYVDIPTLPAPQAQLTASDTGVSAHSQNAYNEAAGVWVVSPPGTYKGIGRRNRLRLYDDTLTTPLGEVVVPIEVTGDGGPLATSMLKSQGFCAWQGGYAWGCGGDYNEAGVGDPNPTNMQQGIVLTAANGDVVGTWLCRPDGLLQKFRDATGRPGLTVCENEGVATHDGRLYALWSTINPGAGVVAPAFGQYGLLVTREFSDDEDALDCTDVASTFRAPDTLRVQTEIHQSLSSTLTSPIDGTALDSWADVVAMMRGAGLSRFVMDGVGQTTMVDINNAAVDLDGNTYIEFLNLNGSNFLVTIEAANPARCRKYQLTSNGTVQAEIPHPRFWHRTGSGTPEGAVTAPVGVIYSRTDGGAGTSLYVKESGTGNTGWVAK